MLIKEQVDEKGCTVCTYMHADCLLKNTSTKDTKYVVNQKLEHVDDISFIEQLHMMLQICNTSIIHKQISIDIIHANANNVIHN